jgi:hypothetical protein
MRKIFILLTVLVLTAESGCSQNNPKDQLFMEPIVISGYGIDDDPQKFVTRILSFYGKSELFIQEQARIAFNYYSNVHVINLTEESAQKIGSQKIGVVFVNNAGIMRPPYSEKELITLEVFPIKANAYILKQLSEHWQIPAIYFCKYYKHQKAEQKSSMKMHDDFERDITRFLENPPVGKTLSESVISMLRDRIDSRYTPLLIKNLANDGEITLEHHGHAHGWYGDGTPVTEEIISYSTVRISDFVRERLKRIFDSYEGWRFAVPGTDASAEEWQIWLDDLSKNDNKNSLLSDGRVEHINYTIFKHDQRGIMTRTADFERNQTEAIIRMDVVKRDKNAGYIIRIERSDDIEYWYFNLINSWTWNNVLTAGIEGNIAYNANNVAWIDDSVYGTFTSDRNTGIETLEIYFRMPDKNSRELYVLQWKVRPNSDGEPVHLYMRNRPVVTWEEMYHSRK